MERLEVTETFAGIALPGHLHTAESLQFATNFPFRDTDVVIVTYPKSGEWHWVGRGQGWGRGRGDGMEGGALTLSPHCRWVPALPAWPGAGPALHNHHPLPAQPHSWGSRPHHHAGGDDHPHALPCCSPVPATSPPPAWSNGWGLKGAVLLYCSAGPAVPCATLHSAVLWHTVRRCADPCHDTL